MQGDPDLETDYASEPLDVARRWRRAGADWVHVVNLDGAFGERSTGNLAALERILRGKTGLQVQFGGGLRDLASVWRAVDLGVSRVVLGTAAVETPALVDAVLEIFGTAGRRRRLSRRSSWAASGPPRAFVGSSSPT
jgi:phosphoribosylformimino-5-aminoimidazole carboxamide ribotide isomerase